MCSLIEMTAGALFLDERRQRVERRADVADNAKIDRHTPAYVFGAHIHLRDAYSRATGIELAVGEVRAEHQQHVAIARRKANQSRHADVKLIIPLDVFLASERMHDGRLQAIGQCKNVIMCVLASRTAQHGHAALAVEERGEAIDVGALRYCDRAAGQQAFCFRRRRVGGRQKRYVARNDDDRDAAIADSLPDGDLQGAGHLVSPGNQLAIVTALLKQAFRMGLLEISGADLGRRNLGRNRKHWHPRSVAVEQAVDEVQVARPATASANGEVTRKMRLGAGREGGNLLVPDMDPIDLSLSAQGIGEAVEAIADNAVDPPHPRRYEDLRELISYPLCHLEFPKPRCPINYYSWRERCRGAHGNAYLFEYSVNTDDSRLLSVT